LISTAGRLTTAIFDFHSRWRVAHQRQTVYLKPASRSPEANRYRGKELKALRLRRRVELALLYEK